MKHVKLTKRVRFSVLLKTFSLHVSFLNVFFFAMCAHFGVESGMIFEGTTRVYERICGFNSKWVRTNSRWILRNRFCCCFDRSNGDIIS